MHEQDIKNHYEKIIEQYKRLSDMQLLIFEGLVACYLQLQGKVPPDDWMDEVRPPETGE